MSDSTVSTASLGIVRASAINEQRLAGATGPTAATLPRVDLPTLATPSAPRPDARPTLLGATAAGIPAQVAAHRPVDLPDVDWSFVAAVPEPPMRGHVVAASGETLDPLAAAGAPR